MLYNNVSNIRAEFKSLLAAGEFVTDKTGVKTVEVVGASFIADEPTIFGTPNEDYIKREIAWYESMSLRVDDIPGGAPTIWKQVASKSGYINSNYGWAIWHTKNYEQYFNTFNELLANPNSRRAVMIYTRPSMWKDYNVNGCSDFMCTNTVQYLIRDGKIHAVVQMRSNDVVFGYRNDYAWQSYVLDLLCRDLGRDRGDIHWTVGSLHVYEKHFDLIK